MLKILRGTIGALCGGSLYAAYYLNLAAGGIIVLLAALVLGRAFIVAPRYGVLAHVVQRRRLNRAAE